MEVKEKEDLARYTTFKMGGIAEKMYFPESEEELVELIAEGNKKHLISGGSNLLIAEKIFPEVINLRKFSDKIEIFENGCFVVGASVRLQKLINTINENGYGGIEYLYSVPACVGGAIVMNAGRGKTHNLFISDYIMAVKVLYQGKVLWLEKEDCLFSYRASVFKNNQDYIILAAKFCFPAMSKEESGRLKKERLELCKKVQDSSAPNFGTVFCTANQHIMWIMQKPL